MLEEVKLNREKKKIEITDVNSKWLFNALWLCSIIAPLYACHFLMSFLNFLLLLPLVFLLCHFISYYSLFHLRLMFIFAVIIAVITITSTTTATTTGAFVLLLLPVNVLHFFHVVFSSFFFGFLRFFFRCDFWISGKLQVQVGRRWAGEN